MLYYIGIDIGGTNIKIGLFNKLGKLENSWEIETNATDEGKNIVKRLVDFLVCNIDMSNVKSIGIGVPGIIENNIVVEAVNLNWYNYDLKSDFLSELNNSSIEVYLENDARVAALGEYSYLKDQIELESLYMITLGTGVGGGLVDNHKIVDDIDILSNEIGHLPIDDIHNYNCPCGQTGCLETVSSATGMVTVAKDRLKEYHQKSLLVDKESINAKVIVDSAKQGDFLASMILNDAIKPLVKAINIVFEKINPEVIVIGGGVSKAGNFYLDKIYDYALEKGYNWNQKVKLAKLDNTAGIYGAYALAIKK